MKHLMNLVKASMLLVMGVSLMGAKGCQDPKPEERQLRRRVAMGGFEAAPGSDVMPLPQEAGGGSFNFAYAATAQLQSVLRETKTFSAVNAFYDPATIGAADKAAFYECSAKNKTSAFDFSPEAVCMVNQPLARISARVVDFRFLRGGGVDLGFTDLGFLKGISAQFDQAKLTMDFYATNPMLPGPDSAGFYIGSVQKKEYFNSVKGKVDLSFGLLSTGISGYFRSDLAEVVKNTMEAGFSDLKAQWDKKDSSYGAVGGWYATIIKNCDDGILISAGNDADAGLRQGDILTVYNVDYQWSGAVCNSQLQFAIQHDKPIAYARVTTTADTVSRAVIIENDPAYPHVDGRILPGGRVYLKKFVDPAPATK